MWVVDVNKRSISSNSKLVRETLKISWESHSCFSMFMGFGPLLSLMQFVLVSTTSIDFWYLASLTAKLLVLPLTRSLVLLYYHTGFSCRPRIFQVHWNVSLSVTIVNVRVILAVAEQLGKIACLCWSPYGEVLGVTWDKGGISVWSVFGSLLWCFFAENGR